MTADRHSPRTHGCELLIALLAALLGPVPWRRTAFRARSPGHAHGRRSATDALSIALAADPRLPSAASVVPVRQPSHLPVVPAILRWTACAAPAANVPSPDGFVRRPHAPSLATGTFRDGAGTMGKCLGKCCANERLPVRYLHKHKIARGMIQITSS